MRAVRYHEFGDPTVMNVEDIEPLDPAPDEVRVAVEAAGINPCDALRREGLWDDTLPLIPGSDLAGVVEAVGREDGTFAVGDRVFGTVPMLNVTGTRGDRQGTYAERVVVRTDRLAQLPGDVPFEVGAAVGLVGATAWRALVELGDLEPGQTCFVHGGTGGVGHVAVQLADATGATVVATARDDRLDRLREFGADVAVDYDRDDLEAAVEDAVDGGLDLVLDHRFGEYAQFDVNVAGYGGDVLVIGGNYDEPQVTDLTEAIGKDLTIQPFDVFNLDAIDEVLRRLGTLLAAGDLSTAVARTYDLSEAEAAHRDVANDSFVGKLVLEP